jgi:hypothetical protein
MQLRVCTFNILSKESTCPLFEVRIYLEHEGRKGFGHSLTVDSRVEILLSAWMFCRSYMLFFGGWIMQPRDCIRYLIRFN